jgi:hypothetical protein
VLLGLLFANVLVVVGFVVVVWFVVVWFVVG